MLNIQLPAKALFAIGPLTITDAMLATMVMSAIIIVFAIWFSRTIKLIPGRTQVALETIQSFWHKQASAAFGDEEVVNAVLPLFLTLFILLVVANQFALIPLAGAMLFGDSLAFRTPTSDISHTIALAIAMIGFAHVIALTVHPIAHIGNFIKLKPLFAARSFAQLGNALLEVFLGLLDIIGECAKILSLSGRLFGNIFAGDVMVLVIASLAAATAYIVPIPFMFLSLFSGFVQAAVFTMLSMLFIAGTSSAHLKERIHAKS